MKKTQLQRHEFSFRPDTTYKKTKSVSYSYRKFSLDGGFKTSSILKMVIDKKRNIGDNSIPKYINALGLKGKKAEYFHHLVKLSNAKNDQLKNQLLNDLKDLILKSNRKTLDKLDNKFFNNWLYPVLRDVACLKGFSIDPSQVIEIIKP